VSEFSIFSAKAEKNKCRHTRCWRIVFFEIILTEGDHMSVHGSRLKITRRTGERVLVDGRIWITVLRGGNSVELLFEAPDDVHILREELALDGQIGLQKRLEQDQPVARKAS
jgi:carbon storage regulator CsrA